jgi:hypothetical protein
MLSGVHSVCSSDSRDDEQRARRAGDRRQPQISCQLGVKEVAIAGAVAVAVAVVYGGVTTGDGRLVLHSDVSHGRFGSSIQRHQVIKLPKRLQTESVRVALSSCTKSQKQACASPPAAEGNTQTWLPQWAPSAPLPYSPGATLDRLWLVCMPKSCLGGIGAGFGSPADSILPLPSVKCACIRCAHQQRRHGTSLPVCSTPCIILNTRRVVVCGIDRPVILLCIATDSGTPTPFQRPRRTL